MSNPRSVHICEWLTQVGELRVMFVICSESLMNLNPMYNPPVPDKVCTVHMRVLGASPSSKMKDCTVLHYAALPPCGNYSKLSIEEEICFWACITDGRTYGLPSSVF